MNNPFNEIWNKEFKREKHLCQECNKVRTLNKGSCAWCNLQRKKKEVSR